MSQYRYKFQYLAGQLARAADIIGCPPLAVRSIDHPDHKAGSLDLTRGPDGYSVELLVNADGGRTALIYGVGYRELLAYLEGLKSPARIAHYLHSHDSQP
tara:strand:- start:182 stop:481 length:300 start_codon:yes stop_codon:yes gene_type:complete